MRKTIPKQPILQATYCKNELFLQNTIQQEHKKGQEEALLYKLNVPIVDNIQCLLRKPTLSISLGAHSCVCIELNPLIFSDFDVY